MGSALINQPVITTVKYFLVTLKKRKKGIEKEKEIIIVH